MNLLSLDITKDDEPHPESLKTAADIDYALICFGWHAALPADSIFLWLIPHAIEKYCKSLILYKSMDNYSTLKKIGHKLEKIWQECPCPSLKTSEFDTFIEEVNKIDTGIRYGEVSQIGIGPELLAYTLLLCTALRFEILKLNTKPEYKDTKYGMDKYITIYQQSKLSFDLKNFVYKFNHLFFEHHITLSPSGRGLSIESLRIQFDSEYLKLGKAENDCPYCKGTISANPQEQCDMIAMFLQGRE